MGSQGASCFHTLTNDQVDLSPAQVQDKWNDLSHPQVMTSVDVLTSWKADIEKLCTDSGECTYEQQQTQQKLLEFVQRMDILKMQME